MRYSCALIALSALFAQPALPQGEPQKARLEGVIISGDGVPVSRAQVRLQGEARVVDGRPVSANYSATSGEDGKFIIDNIIPASTLSLTAQKAGFTNTRYGARSGSSPAVPLSLDAGETLKDLVIRMVPQAVLNGRISDVRGEFVEGVQVVLLRRGYTRGLRQLTPAATVTSNDQGEFRFAGLTPGRYYLLVRRLGTFDNDSIPLPTYYPNSSDARGAAAIEVTAGQEIRGVDVRILQARGFTVRGKVLDRNGAPLSDATVLPIPEGIANGVEDSSAFLMRTTTRTLPDGSFELKGVLPGAYVLEVVTESGRRSGGRFPVSVANQDISGLTLLQVPPITVTGSVRLEGGAYEELLPTLAAPAGITAAAPRIGLTQAAGVQVVELLPGARLNPDGSFAVENVMPGQYVVTPPAFPGVYVKSMTFDRADATHSVINLNGNANLQVVLARNGATLAGSAQNEKGEPQAGVFVSLWRRDLNQAGSINSVRIVATDRKGGFRFGDVPPGSYYASAWEDIDAGMAQDRAFLSKFTASAIAVELKESANVSQILQVVPITKIKDAAATLD